MRVQAIGIAGPQQCPGKTLKMVCSGPDLRLERDIFKCAHGLAAMPGRINVGPGTIMPEPFRPIPLLMSKLQKRQTHGSGHAAQHRAVIAVSQRHMVFEP